MSRVSGTHLPEWSEIRHSDLWLRIRPEHRRSEQMRFFAHNQARQETARRAVFIDLLPHIDEVRFLHPHPLTYREIARAARKARRIGWNIALCLATITNLDVSVDRQWRWMCLIQAHGYLQESNLETSPVFDAETILEFPEGIPVGTPTAKERLEFHPDTNAWDVEDAALLELELGAGGMAELLIGESAARAATITRVRTYKAKNLAALPDDPWDPNHWGHDARLASLTARRAGSELALTPAFDPAITDYAIAGPIAGASLRFEPQDQAAVTVASSTSTSRIVTVTAADGSTVKTYTVSEAPA